MDLAATVRSTRIGWKVLCLDAYRLWLDGFGGLPIPCRKGRRVPAGFQEAQILAFAVIDFGVKDVRGCGLPVRVRGHPLHLAVGVFDAQLRAEAQAACLRSCWAAGTTRAGSHTIPARAARPSHSSLWPSGGDVVGLVVHMFAIVGPSRREDCIAYALAIEEELVCAQRGGINPRGFDGAGDCEGMAEGFHGIGNPGVAQAAGLWSLPAPRVPSLESSRLNRRSLCPASRRRHELRTSSPCRWRRLPWFRRSYSTTSVAIMGGGGINGHAVGVGDIVHRLNGDGVGALRRA